MEDELWEERKWLLLIHAFNSQGEFLCARLVPVDATMKVLDRLTYALSTVRKMDSVDKNDSAVRNLLGEVVPRFSLFLYDTLRVMSFSPYM